jgi:hypothetical protein
LTVYYAAVIVFLIFFIGKEGKMPKIFEKDGFKFFFYSNEHEPIHVHVWLGGGEAVFVVSGEDVELRSSVNMKVGDLSRARQLVIENQGLIQEKWNEFFK